MKTTKKIKELKGIIALCLMIGLAASLGGPGITVAETVNTGFTAATGGSNNDTPIIKAKWESPDNYLNINGTQIDPPGNCGQQQPVEICTIIYDDSFNDTMTRAQINAALNAEAWMYYKEGPGCNNYDCYTRVNPENEPISLSAKTKLQGISLFCNGVGQTNPSTVAYYGIYDYDEICNNVDGELYEGTARVFCGTHPLSYEAAGGTYKVRVKATDVYGANSYTSSSIQDEINEFDYVPTVAYEIDFDAINYGALTQYEWDRDMDGNNMGNGTWETPVSSNRPTVRNVGNVLLQMTVNQSNLVNVTTPGHDIDPSKISFEARVGNLVGSWTPYVLNTTTPLLETLDLSTKTKMDFAIKVDDFMQQGDEYAGIMTIGAIPIDFSDCPTSIHTEWQCPL